MTLQTLLITAATFTALTAAQALASDFDPGQANHSADQAESTSAVESAPSSSTPSTIAPNGNFSATQNPSTAADEADDQADCQYDLNGDGNVDFDDYLEMLSAWSNQAVRSSDDSRVDFTAIIGLMSAWGSC